MKKCENPLIPEITKTYKKRIFNLSNIRLPEGIKKKCVWCLGELSGLQRRWCSDDCVVAAQAWGNPQKEQGLYQLLIKQNWKCNLCTFDWGTVVEAMFNEPKLPYGFKEYKDTWRTQYSFWVVTKVKDRMHQNDPPHRIEVDHILAISKGGQSLGLDNHQAICYTCHKVKTKSDLSGKRKKLEDDRQDAATGSDPVDNGRTAVDSE